MAKAEVIEQLFKFVDEKPLKLYDYQKKWVNDDTQFRIVNKSRQTGFSFVCALEALVKAIFVPRSLILFVSTGERGALRLMKYVLDAWYMLPKELRDELNPDTISKQEISFKTNQSRIISLPNNPATVRGFPATDIYLDEFAFFENEDKMWEAILPSISRTELLRRVSIISTPNGKLNHFHKIYIEEAVKAGDIWSRHSVHHTDCPDIDITKIKTTMDDTQFRQEYCCEFIDSATSAIPLELILKCVDEKLKPPTNLDSNRIIYVGIDFGKKRDSTVAAFFEKTFINGDPEPTFIMRELISFVGEDYETQLPKIEARLKQLNANQVWVDQTGVGEKLVEDVRKMKGKWHVNGVIFSRQWKESAVSDIILLMQSGKVKLFNNDELIKQLHGLQRKVTQHNNLRFEHAVGEHDDIFWAITLALSKASHRKGFFGMTGAKALM